MYINDEILGEVISEYVARCKEVGDEETVIFFGHMVEDICRRMKSWSDFDELKFIKMCGLDNKDSSDNDNSNVLSVLEVG